MVTVVTTRDGMETKPYTTDSDIALIGAGTWYGAATPAPDTDIYPGTAWVGYNAGQNRRYNPAFAFEALAIDPNASIATATITLSMAAAYKYTTFTVRHYADPNTSPPSNSFLPDAQVVGSASASFSSATDANSASLGYWAPATNPITINIKNHLQELVNHPNWASGKALTIVLRANPYDSDGTSQGSYMFYTLEHGSGNPAVLNYTLTVQPTITSVGGDDSIFADESNVTIVGTGLATATALRIYSGGNSYPQTISTKSSTQIQFNAAGNIPTGAGYTIEVTIDTALVTRTIEVINESTVIDNVTQGLALTSIDGQEYIDEATGFPGTWETKASPTSTIYFNDGLLIGKLELNIYKASIKVGPIIIDKGATVYLADLNLTVLENHKHNNLIIQAVADPNDADIGASNIISSQTLTTASASILNSEWSNSSDIAQWVQTVNPKNLDITAILQEVVDHANWVSGDYLQLVIDYSDLGGVQGYTRIGTNDEAGSSPATLSYSVDNGVTITSVSSDDVIELGELGATIIGKNLSGASNLVITKAAISEAQTILTNTDTAITFDVDTGAIIAGTGYTVSFDVASVTYSHTVAFVQGGGINTGTGDPTVDGYEDTVTGTWYDEYAAQGANIIGYSPFLSAQRGTAAAKIGPIQAQQGQTFTTGDLTWACDWVQGAFKGFEFRIYAVADPDATDVGSGNLPSSQVLTTAYTDIDTLDWTGVELFTYWQPGAEVIDISAVVQEVVGHSNWAPGKYVQLIFRPEGYPSGEAGVSFNSVESGSTLLSFEYATLAATNIASINGNDEIRAADTGIKLLGNDLEDATALSITDGTYTQAQTILTNTSTEITFDFLQGSLGYGAGTITVTKSGTPYTFSLTLLPEVGRSYVVVGTPGTGDNSLTFNENPELVSGDIIDYLSVSANGFTTSITSSGIPTIQGGSQLDSFTARAYIASTGTWYDLQTITFLKGSYFIRNYAPLLEYSATVGSGSVVTSDGGEVWALQDDIDVTESWT